MSRYHQYSASSYSPNGTPATPLIPYASLPPSPSSGLFTPSYLPVNLPPVSPSYGIPAAPHIPYKSLPQVSPGPSNGLLTPPWTPVSAHLPTLYRMSSLLTQMSFDISLEPRSDRNMSQAATNPPVPSLILISPNLQLPLQITVHATLAPYVTILDICQSLHKHLMRQISQTDFSYLNAEAVWTTYNYRTQNDRQSSGGPSRIDSLYGYHMARFGGLSEGPKGLTLAVDFGRAC